MCLCLAKLATTDHRLQKKISNELDAARKKPGPFKHVGYTSTYQGRKCNSYLTHPLLEVVRVHGPGSLCQVRNQVLLQSLE